MSISFDAAPGVTWKPVGYSVDNGISFSAVDTLNAKEIAAYQLPDGFASGTYMPPDIPDWQESLPESMCGNCRRDWHSVPLTETVAGMYDGLSFDEGYDPVGDVSRLVCPGSDCCGPALPRGTRPPVMGPAGSWGKIMMTGETLWKSTDNITWTVTGDSTYTVTITGTGTVLTQDGAYATATVSSWDPTTDDHLVALLQESLPPITVTPWLPGDDVLQEAASEVAPKAIEMAHKPPVSTGFDFTGFPGYQPPKGKKKK